MVRMNTTHMVLYIIGVVLVLLLLGMLGSHNKEGFEVPDVSSAEDVSSGASSLYGWGYEPIRKDVSSSSTSGGVPDQKINRRCPQCENIYIDKVDLITPSSKNVCYGCDITQNKDIDKYVLKSSVPPCPNMSDYAKKTQLPPAGFNPDEWIRKSEIPPCPVCPDMKDYILKSDIPSCEPEKICPKCPECPVCPKCPPCGQPKVKIVEKVVYKDRPRSNGGYMPQALGNHYPQAGSIWRPKLSDSNSGFISPDIPMAGNTTMTRRFQELQNLRR